MAITITSADQRLSVKPKVNILMVGPAGVGKTKQLGTMPEETTLALDLEAGLLSLNQETIMPDGSVLPPWRGDSIDVREEARKLGCHPWEFARAFACVLSGPDPSVPASDPYSKQMYDLYCKNVISPDVLAKYENIFVDSITVGSRHSFSWSKMQPQAFSEKTGKPDTRGSYGLLGQEMVKWATQLQHAQGKNVILVGLLNKEKDEFGRISFEMQMEGGKSKQELPGIFDEVLTLGTFSVDKNSGAMAFDMDKGNQRAFICHKENPFGVPAKDRSGTLDMLEAPDLGSLIKKIQSVKAQTKMVTTMPAVTQVSAEPVMGVPPQQPQTTLAT